MGFPRLQPFLAHLWVVLCCLTAQAQGARLLEDALHAWDGGRNQEFRFAADELQMEGEVEPVAITPAGNLPALKEKAKDTAKMRKKKVELVLYPVDALQTKYHRRILSSEILFWTRPGFALGHLDGAIGATPAPGLGSNAFLLRLEDSVRALEVLGVLRTHPGIASAQPQLARLWQKKLTPNDSLFSQQWHLKNTGQNGGVPGIDLNLANVWNTYRGSNIVIGIVDDGLQHAHPDLAPNYNGAIDYDFNFNDLDPSPESGDDHGTAVAGVAAARGSNGQGVAGVAYQATLVGLRLTAFPTTDAQDAAAMAHSNSVIHVKNNSWGAPDCDTVSGPGPLTMAALEEGALRSRGGRGVHYVWAGGNGAECADNVNYDGYANSIYVLPIGAMSDGGTRASYSERGACLVASAPSSSEFRQNITTTDRTGDFGYNYTGAPDETGNRDYTQWFGGTSSAAPAAAGVVALMLQANPDLGYRDTKEILMRSSTPLQFQTLIWSTNSAGIWHNHNLGAGLINAEVAVSFATNWMRLGPVTNVSEERFLSVPIPDDDDNGVAETFVFTNAGFRVEHATVTMDAPHEFEGDLHVQLTSPLGVESFLAERSSRPGLGYQNWTFSSVRHWGEKAEGVWTVRVSDRFAPDTGVLNYLKLTLHGSIPQARLRVTKNGGNAQIELRSAAPGWSYAIDASDDLANWTEVAVRKIPGSGKAVYTESVSSRNFFRARLIP